MTRTHLENERPADSPNTIPARGSISLGADCFFPENPRASERGRA